MDKSKLVRLEFKYNSYLTNFDCLNEDETFNENFNSKKRKKFKKHSKEINNFLVNEALVEQNQGLNTTHLLIKAKKLVGFISLCSDSIRLETEEKEKEKVLYSNIPALKIARLAIDKNCQHKGFGVFLINYAVKIASDMRENMGIKFITVDCYEHRLSYYKKQGFIINNIQNPKREPDSPLSLRLNIDTYLENLNI